MDKTNIKDVDLQDLLYEIFLRSPNNLFDEFILECQKWYESPAHSFSEMRMRQNKKIRGDMFEEFCVLYLKYVKNYSNVWLLKDVPTEILYGLKLKRQDMGIDIISQSFDNNYVAIQCKYKKHVSKKQNILSWKSLSTFYALCLRSGPWSKYIIMTNCIYTRHQGEKTEKDISYCLKTLQNISKDDWVKMCGKVGAVLGKDSKEEPIFSEIEINKEHEEMNETIIEIKKKIIKKITVKTPVLSKEELRNLRANYYDLDK